MVRNDIGIEEKVTLIRGLLSPNDMNKGAKERFCHHCAMGCY